MIFDASSMPLEATSGQARHFLQAILHLELRTGQCGREVRYYRFYSLMLPRTLRPATMTLLYSRLADRNNTPSPEGRRFATLEHDKVEATSTNNDL